MVGRNPEYSARTTLTLPIEAAVKEQFKKICARKGVDMADVINEHINKYIKNYKDADQSLEAFMEQPEQAPPVEKQPVILSLDLDKLINKQELKDFIHSLELGHAARLQGASNFMYGVSKIVVQQRKAGIPPIPLKFANDAVMYHPLPQQQ